MELKIKHCNNIDAGILSIVPNKLNLKFGLNGTGKSTISRAIKLKIENAENLIELVPFKHRKDNEIKPIVELNEEIKSVLIFNEDYLNQFLFKEDELISNSYEILIKTTEYSDYLNNIEKLLSEIKLVFSKNEKLDDIILDFQNLSKSFSSTQKGLSKSSAVYKGLKEGNKVEHIPEILSGYSKLIKNDDCVSWLDWQNKGTPFLEISDDCPYCTSPTTEKKETIKSISKFYNKTVVKNFNVIIKAINNLGDYFSESAFIMLQKITQKQTGLDDSEMNYLFVMKQQIDDLLLKFIDLKEISPATFNENNKVKDELEQLKIDINLFDRLNSDKTVSIIESLNKSLDLVLEKVGLLQGEINKQKKLVAELIQKHKLAINSFLINAGYKYEVEIESKDSNEYKLLLRHIESEESISGGKQYLSFGEKNAFSLVLFMYEALNKQPDLIILDDPISSFDKSKKYAIMHMLFRGKSVDCLLNKTVLLLTHDLDPIIDTVKVLKEFKNLSVASFLTTENGMLNETEIKKNNILSFSQICEKVINSDNHDIIKLIYLRRNYEILNDLGNEYQVLSNLFHKRSRTELKDNRKEIGNDSFDNEHFELGLESIKQSVPGFNYDSILGEITDIENLIGLYEDATNNYSKLNLFRLICSENLKNLHSVLRKFINETFHIENELISQLDPEKYNVIPQFIIEECNKYIIELKENYP